VSIAATASPSGLDTLLLIHQNLINFEWIASFLGL
jgi:hypothetical protein